ncbi:MAG: hypothetical protein FIB08_09805 [Candidatus Methanoperedens sp.]|nr:hypothetical protein [Candidatus Methanoperedens sp.]
MKRMLTILLVIAAILISGCVSTVNPVNPEDVIVKVSPITAKEFQEIEFSLSVLNNATEPIDNVKVASFDPFTVLAGGNVNIPARTKEEPSFVSLNAKVQAGGFKDTNNITTLALSYASGKDKDGKAIIKTKTVPVQTTVLPDAKLQFVGFVKDPGSRSGAELTTWTIEKGGNATITFSVKNEGKTTIDENTLKVFVDIENKRIGSNATFEIGEAMAKGGTSYTEAVVLPIIKNAPNGETDVIVTLLMDDKIIDKKTLQLTVKL